MNVAILADHFGYFAGGTRNVCTLIKALNREGIVPHVLSYHSHHNYEKNVESMGYDIRYEHRLLLPSFFRYGSLYKGYIAKVLGTLPKEKTYDFVYDFSGIFPEYDARGLYYMYFDYWNMERKGIRKFYAMFFPRSKLMRLFSHPTITVITQSEYVQGIIQEQYGVHLPIVYPPVDTHKWAGKANKDGTNVVSIGSFFHHKDQLLQIEIAKRVRESGLPFMFFLVGQTTYDAYYRACEKKAKETPNVRLFPTPTEKELGEIIEKSTYFLSSCKKEHFGIATVEALSAGLIPIVPNSGGSVELVPERRLRYDTVEEAVEIFSFLSSLSPQERESMRKKLSRGLERFNEEVFSRRMLDFLSSY